MANSEKDNSVALEVIGNFLNQDENHKTGFDVNTQEDIKLHTSVIIEGIENHVYRGTWGKPYDRCHGKKKAQEYLMKYVKGLIRDGYLEELFNYLIGFKSQLDISSVEKIKLNSGGFEALSKDSKRKVVLYKVISKLESTYNPVFIEYSSVKLPNDSSEFEDFQNLELSKYSRDSIIHFFDIDKFDTEEKINDEKRRLKIQYLIENINGIISFFIQYSEELKKDISLGSVLKIDVDSSLMYKFKELFLSSKEFNINSILEFLNTISHKDQAHFKTIMKIAGTARSKTEAILNGNMGVNFNVDYTENDLSSELGFNTKPNGGISAGYLPFSSDFGKSSFEGMESFLSYSHANGLYKARFSKMISHFAEKLSLENPSSVGLNRFYLSNIQLLGKRNGLYNGSIDKDQKITSQCNIGFDVADFTDNDLITIGTFFCSVVGNLNMDIKEMVLGQGYLNSKIGNKGDLKCKGLFIPNSGFENNNIVLLEGEDSGDKELFVNLSNFTLDKYVFTSVQLAYFLKHKSFIDSKLLYANIYHLYNESYIEGAEIYNIESFDTQYRDFIKHVIAPNSSQYEGKVKSSHTLLLGTQGTGKSQFLLNLIKNKKFGFNKAEFDLNSVVVPIDLEQLKKLIEDGDTSYIKNRLREIQEKTGLSLIIVVEDICTLIEENEGTGKSNIISQGLTTLFEGVGSLPNITIVSTTNYPGKLPPRLTRKGRFDCMIPFLPLDDREKAKGFFHTHINRNGLDNLLDEKFIEIYIDRFYGTTPSHIANFIEEIKREIEFRNITGIEEKINEQEIEKIFNNLNFSISAIKLRQEEMELWLKDLRIKDEGPNMLFANTDSKDSNWK